MSSRSTPPQLPASLPPPPKSSQLDVPLIDDALYSILVPRLRNMFQYLPSSYSLVKILQEDEDVLSTILKCLVLISTSMLNVEGGTPFTPAMSTLGLKLTPNDDEEEECFGSLFSKRNDKSTHHYHYGQQRRQPPPPTLSQEQNDQRRKTQMKNLCFIICSAILPMIYKKIQYKLHHYQHSSPNPSPSEENEEERRINELAHQRKKRMLEYILKFTQRVVPTLRVVNYLVFLGSSSSRTSPPATLAMRLSGLKYASNNDPGLFGTSIIGDSSSLESATKGGRRQQHVNFMFAYRRLLFEEIIRTMVMILPMALLLPSGTSSNLPSWMNPSVLQMRIRNSIRQRINRMKYYFKVLLPSSVGDNDEESSMSCAICSTKQITIPYISKSCGHAFCYSCLRLAVIDNLKYSCPECGVVVESSCRLSSPSSC